MPELANSGRTNDTSVHLNEALRINPDCRQTPDQVRDLGVNVPLSAEVLIGSGNRRDRKDRKAYTNSANACECLRMLADARQLRSDQT